MTKEEKTIGGYIELQLPPGKSYHPSLIKLNTGRNAFEYLLKIRKYKLVYLPYFTCEVLLEPLYRLKIPFLFYHIDKNLEPILNFKLSENDCMVYSNYFGIRDEVVLRLSQQIPNLIIDNAQAFFSLPIPGTDSFYSCRKFFGVPDGAYLYTNSNIRLSLESDISVYRFSHLIKSIDLSVETGYHDYLKNNLGLVNNPIKKMSVLTQQILSGIDYETCKAARNTNFTHLHLALSKFNEIPIDADTINGPMVYPLLMDKPGARKMLIAKKIYVATYWPNIFDWTTEDMFEHYLAKNLLPLPIDHRYGAFEMERIIKTIRQLR